MKHKRALAVAYAPYSTVKDGDYFVTAPVCGNRVGTAFLQTSDNTTFADYCVPNGPNGSHVPGHRPQPTRLWDGAFYGLGDKEPVCVVSRKEAIANAKAYRSL